jgi:hypothetical protein
MTRPTHRRRVPEEKGLMARSMAKSSTIGAGIHGGAAPRRSWKATGKRGDDSRADLGSGGGDDGGGGRVSVLFSRAHGHGDLVGHL